MAPSPLPEQLTDDEVGKLFDLVEAAILESLEGRTPTTPTLDTLPARLRLPTGVFVTLFVGGELNGCIGSIDGREPLGQAVGRLGCAAAFADPRLPALRREDWDDLDVEISLLGEATPIAARSWAQLVHEVRPGQDGVILRAGSRQGLFLPSVWGQLPDPLDFIDQLYRKAELPPRSWPTGMQALRFAAAKYSRPARTHRAA